MVVRRAARRSNIRVACRGNACFITCAPCAARRSHTREHRSADFPPPTKSPSSANQVAVLRTTKSPSSARPSRLPPYDQAAVLRRPCSRPPPDHAAVLRPTMSPPVRLLCLLPVLPCAPGMPHTHFTIYPCVYSAPLAADFPARLSYFIRAPVCSRLPYICVPAPPPRRLISRAPTSLHLPSLLLRTPILLICAHIPRARFT